MGDRLSAYLVHTASETRPAAVLLLLQFLLLPLRRLLRRYRSDLNVDTCVQFPHDAK